MKIENLNFVNLSEYEKQEMFIWAQDVLINGKIAYPRPAFVQKWLDESGFGDDQYLLVASTVLPARILYSIVKEQFDYIEFPPPIGTKVKYKDSRLYGKSGKIVELTNSPIYIADLHGEMYKYYGAKVLWDDNRTSNWISLSELNIEPE